MIFSLFLVLLPAHYVLVFLYCKTLSFLTKNRIDASIFVDVTTDQGGHMFKTLCSVLLAFAFSAGVNAQVVVEAPKYAEKETWVYEKVDRFNGALTERYSQTISGITGDRFTLRVKSEQGAEYNSVFTTEGNVVSNQRGAYTTFQPILRFPMKAGASWNAPFEVRTNLGPRFHSPARCRSARPEKHCHNPGPWVFRVSRPPA